MTLRLKAVLAGLSLAALVAGCANEERAQQPSQAPQTQQAPAPQFTWQSAIGELDIGQPGFHCSAVLVARNLIATASHCLTVAAENARPVIFSPGYGGARGFPTAQAVALKLGGRVSSGAIRSEDVPLDWALLQISPPITTIQPLPVASLSLNDMLARAASGGQVIAAGYGDSDTLRARTPCPLLSQQELGLYPDDSWLQLDCVIEHGDSGGAIVLVDGGRPWLIGVIAGSGKNPKVPGKSMALAANARNFAPYVVPVALAAPAPSNTVASAQ
jgi:hypothetical protein